MINYEYEKERSNKNDYFYNQHDVNLKFDPHIHSSFEFIYVSDGILTLNIDNTEYEITQDECAFILPNQIHSYFTKNYSKSRLCVFSNEYVYDFYEKSRGMSFENPICKPDKNTIIPQALFEDNSDYYLRKSHFYRIISMFLQKTKLIKRNDKQLDSTIEILEFIDKNFDKDVSLLDLEQKIGLSYNYLSSIINKTFKTNFCSLLNNRRIYYAQYLLRTSSENITEVALSSGYDSIRTFNRNFKAINVISPKEYREKFRKNP
ncbi:MAG: AraC family transcriptional regulator [Clostridiales bacterium]|jgi:AraC-like DNA-binding protein|nr:AraC family transcriptional regulator [Clostridiales bacterium]